MSYDIYFVKKDDLNNENVYEVLEIQELAPNNELFISKELWLSIIKEFETNGYSFEKIEGDDFFELNFKSFQLSMLHTQIVLSLPYWNENLHEKVMDDIESITTVMKKYGLKSFNAQTEQIDGQSSLIKHQFKETLNMINNNTVLPKTQKQLVIRRIVFILAMILIGFLISVYFPKT